MPSSTQRSGDQGAGNQGSAKKSAKKSRPDKYDYYAFQLPFKYTDPNYRIIKVRLSETPGKRGSDISSGIDKQTSNEDFKCNFSITYGDNATTTISEAKSCLKFLRVVACKGEKSDCERREDRLRCLLGLQVANDFINQLLSSIPEPDRLKRSCGTTEWVICTSRTAKGVRQEFTSNNLDRNTEGDDKCWDKPDSLVEELKKHLPEIQKASFVLHTKKGSSKKNITFNCS